MTFSFSSGLGQRERGDLLVLPFWEGGEAAGEFAPLKSAWETAIQSGDFQGKKGENVILYVQGDKEPRLLLLGLGKREKICVEGLRRCYANAARTAIGKKAKRINLLFPQIKEISREEALRGIAEGVLLANYAFDELKGDKEHSSALLEQIHWIGVESREKKILDKIMTICSGVYFVRDLVNRNADEKTPQILADTALSLEKVSPQIKTTLFDKKRLQEEKMGLILAVNQGSSVDPFLIQVSYQGNPKSKEHIVLVGKGITYDTGGLSLKPTDGMLTMKSDMAGGAAVLGTIRAAAELGLKVNVTAVVPTAENSIGPKSYKLGDVYRSYSGKTVEIVNTDGEGRLVLADAMSYAVRNLKPSCMIDLATLTGGIIVALGEDIAGFFSTDKDLAKELMASSENTGELLWEMPLHFEYKESLKSDIADMINTAGKEAGAIKAALFMHEFVGSTKWAHLDIAGAAFWTKSKYYHPTKGTGYGLRLLIDFLEKRSRS